MKSRVAIHSGESTSQALDDGRQAIVSREWKLAFSMLSTADRDQPLCAEDLEALSTAAHILGKESESAQLLARAHQAFLDQGESLRAVRCAFWLGLGLLLRGDIAQAGGWLARAGRLLEDQKDCPERGYLLIPEGIRSSLQGDAVRGFDLFHRAAEIGRRFDDKDLVTFGLHGQGRALIGQGKIGEGVTLLDEAMVAVTAGEVSPRVAGGVYCSVIDACCDIFDLRRAHEWTAALDHWCSTQSDQIPYRGHCLIRRAEILQFHGEWSEALNSVELVRDRFSKIASKKEAGAAHYRLAELYRLRGQFDKAKESYRFAHECGVSPQPGLSLLWLRQGEAGAALAPIRQTENEFETPRRRAEILEASIEITLMSGDLDAARAAADELGQAAVKLNAPMLTAIAARANGAIQLAAGDFLGALTILKRALACFRELDAPYDAACVQVLMARAYRAHGDRKMAELELDAARKIFVQLGAVYDIKRVDDDASGPGSEAAGPLSKREIEVLRLVAAGLTNRDIAQQLFISEKTVARHLSNIFVKLDLSSRAAATAYAYQHNVL